MVREIWTNYKRYIKISKKESLLALILGISAAFLETFAIYLLANLISSIEGKNENLNYLNNIFSDHQIYILFLISGIISVYLYFQTNKNIVKAKCRVERFVREEITDITINIKWEYYLKLSQGDISKSILSEGQNISEGYMYFLQSLTYSLIIITYFFICLLFVPDTFIILILYALLAYRIYFYYSKKAELFGKDLSKITSNIGIWTASIFNNLKYIRTISKDKLAQSESKEIFFEFSNAYSNARIASYKSKFVTEIITIIFIFLAIIYISISDSSSSNLILSLSLFLRMTPKVYNAQNRLLDSVAMISWPKLHIEKIIWARKLKDKFKNKVESKFVFNGSIIFKSVSFNYPGQRFTLEDVNLTINKNESLGIVGKSGAGKSTFLDLFTGIIKPKKGKLIISGDDINNININKWRENIGIVMQENYFKNDSLAANIALGEKNINRHKVKESLLISNAWNFVKELPNGIDEIILDRGMRFSGGERQKLALARALYLEPKILILDEPSSGLDLKSEQEFIQTIKKLLGTMMIIIVSHKKGLVNICDRVLTIEDKKLKKI